MSEIERLLAELCPDGVEFRALADVGTWYGGGTPSKGRADFWTNGTIPWLSPKDMGSPRLAETEDYITEAAVNSSATRLVPANSVALVARSSILDRVLPTALVSVPVTLNQDMKAVVPDHTVLPTYLAHLLRSRGPELLRRTRKTGGSVASIEYPKLLAYRIPVPPLAVQREIAAVLDTMEKLEAELEAELAARRRQYAYYRSALLTLDDSVPSVRIAEVCLTVSSGGTPSSGRGDYYGGDIPWLRTQEIDYVPITQTEMSITQAGLRNSSAKWVPANCVIVAMYGATAAKVAINESPLTTNQACCNLEVNPQSADVRFVFHWLCHRYVHLRSLGEGSQSNLSLQKIKSYLMPLPAVDEQVRIVRILDSFDALVNDLSSGLPAEIAARRKQYEYYRDRLLSFEELAS